MASVTYNGETINCSSILKGTDYLHLLDANNKMIAAFDGIASFDAFTIDGTPTTAPSADNCNVATIGPDGAIHKGGHTCSDIGKGLPNIVTLGITDGNYSISTLNKYIVPSAEMYKVGFAGDPFYSIDVNNGIQILRRCAVLLSWKVAIDVAAAAADLSGFFIGLADISKSGWSEQTGGYVSAYSCPSKAVYDSTASFMYGNAYQPPILVYLEPCLLKLHIINRDLVTYSVVTSSRGSGSNQYCYYLSTMTLQFFEV